MNPLLDIMMYQVEFAGGKDTKLTINVIAESTYTQCDADENKYLLLDTLVDYHRDNKALSPTKQQISKSGKPVTCMTTAGWHI